MSETENPYIPRDDEEQPIPQILLPDNFDHQVDEDLKSNNINDDDEVSAPRLLVPEELYDTIAKQFAKSVWGDMVSTIRANSRLYVSYSNKLLIKYKMVLEDNYIQLNHKKLVGRVNSCLEKLVYLDREMNDELADESPGNGLLISPGSLPPAETAREAQKPRLSAEKQFEQFSITRTGQKEAPYIAEHITSNTILIDAFKVILPISVIEILASWFIQASQKDAATALIFGLLYVLGSTSAFVVSAYYQAMVKGHKDYYKAFKTNFAPEGTYIDPDTEEKLAFFNLPPGTKRTASVTFWSGLTVLLLGFVYRLYIVLTSQDGWSNHAFDLLAIVIIVVSTIMVYTFKCSTFPSLPLNELVRYYDLRGKAEDERKKADEKSKAEEAEASASKTTVDADLPFQMSSNNGDDGEVKYADIRTLWQVKRYYQQEREKMLEEIWNDLRQRDILINKINSRLEGFDEIHKQACSHLKFKWNEFHYKLLGESANRNGNSSPVNENVKQSLLDFYLPMPPEYTELKKMCETIQTTPLNSSLPDEINVEEEFNKLRRKNHRPPYRYTGVAADEHQTNGARDEQ